MKGCNRLTRTGAIVAAVIVVGIATYFAFAASAVAASAATFPVCPTQQQLDARGVKAGQVTSPAQMNTGTFPLTATVVVPDEQCSYQGTLGLLLLYFHLTPKQAAAVQAHLAYECKLKRCKAFASEGSNTIVTTNAATGAQKTTQVTTVNVIVTDGQVEGEASARLAPVTDHQCEVVASALYLWLGALKPVGGADMHDLLYGCSRRSH